jgi:hypothetical protein
LVRDLNLAGLVLNLIGILVLFRWGMPFRVETGGANSLLMERSDEKAIATERIYKIIMYFGLAALVAGTVLQMVAAWMT